MAGRGERRSSSPPGLFGVAASVAVAPPPAASVIVRVGVVLGMVIVRVLCSPRPLLVVCVVAIVCRVCQLCHVCHVLVFTCVVVVVVRWSFCRCCHFVICHV